MVHCAPKHGLDQTGMCFARKFGVGWVKIMGTPNNIKLVFGAWHLLVLAICETPSVSTSLFCHFAMLVARFTGPNVARRACHCHRAGTRCSTGPPSKAPHLRTPRTDEIRSCAAWLHPGHDQIRTTPPASPTATYLLQHDLRYDLHRLYISVSLCL